MASFFLPLVLLVQSNQKYVLFSRSIILAFGANVDVGHPLLLAYNQFVCFITPWYVILLPKNRHWRQDLSPIISVLYLSLQSYLPKATVISG